MSAPDPSAASETPRLPRREKRRVSELWTGFRGWAVQRGDEIVATNPDGLAIAQAVERAKAGKFQELVFDSEGFKAEGAKHAESGFDKLFSWAMDYHAGRVAYFVVKKWDDSPIEIMVNGDMKEGQHRLMAAKYMNLDEVEVLVF